jgi:hypothetical protein
MSPSSLFKLLGTKRALSRIAILFIAISLLYVDSFPFSLLPPETHHAEAYTYRNVTTQSRPASAGGSLSFSFTHNHPSNADTLILASVVPNSTITVTATYAGIPAVLQKKTSITGISTYLLAIEDPPTGSNTVVFTFSANVAATVGSALSYAVGTYPSSAQSSGPSGNPQQCVTSATGPGPVGTPNPLTIQVFGARGATNVPMTGSPGSSAVKRTEMSSGNTAQDIAMGVFEILNTSTVTTCARLATQAIASAAKVINFPAPPPTVNLLVNGVQGPVSVPTNSNVTLSWTTTNSPDFCLGSGSWNGSKDEGGGSEVLGPLTGSATRTYTIDCQNTSGNFVDSVVVNIGASPPPPVASVDLKANGSDGPITVPNNSTVTLSWTHEIAADGCIASGAWSGSKNDSGSEPVGPLVGPASFTYTITCEGQNDDFITDSVTVNIGAAAATDIDCGLRVREGSTTVRVACQPLGTVTSPLRIRKNSTTYGVILVPTTDALASKTRIQTSAGIRALKRLP